MGTVYLAEDAVLGRQVALKVVATGAADAGNGRAHAARGADPRPARASRHRPGARRGRAAGRPRLLRDEACRRGAARRPSRDAAPLPERLRIFQRICEAVAFAHAHGVVHRDLKPENVMVGRFGEVLVMDWGIAKLLADDRGSAAAAARTPARAAQTADGTVVGTLCTWRPSRPSAARPHGPQTDVYALGAVLTPCWRAVRRSRPRPRSAGPAARPPAADFPAPARSVHPPAARSDRDESHGRGPRGTLRLRGGAGRGGRPVPRRASPSGPTASAPGNGRRGSSPATARRSCSSPPIS